MLTILIPGIPLISAPHINEAPLEQDVITQIDSTGSLESNRFTHMESTRAVIQRHSDLTNYNLMQENDKIKLYVNDKSLGIKILDKATGYIWSSDREFREDEELNNYWKNYILSGITINYYDAKKKKVQTTSNLNEKAKVKVSSVDDKVKYEVNFDDLDLVFNVYLNLQDNKLVVSIPYEEIEENGKNKITAVTVFPFLGSTEGDEIPGYVFIPDGSGALMRFENRSLKLNSPFSARVYGKDYGVDLITFGTVNSNSSSYRISLPVYGITHGVKQNAFLARINEGSAYANLMVYPSGVTTKYNWSTFQFIYRQEFFHPTGKDGSGFSDLQVGINEIDIELEYTFLNNETADYIGMAKEYQKDLFKEKQVNGSSTESVPVRLDILGSEIKKSLLGFTTTTLTKTNDVIKMVDELKETGIDNLLIVYKGWGKGGISSRLPSKFPFDKNQGGENGFEKLISNMQEQDVKLYFSADYSTAYENGSGYNKRKDLIRRIDDLPLSFTKIFSNYEIQWFTLNPQATKRIANNDLEKFTKYGMNIAIDKTSYQLFGDYQKGPNREVTMNMYTDIFGTLQEEVDQIMYKPNDYLLNETSAYLDIPMNASGYLYFTDTVPFLQLLLDGYVDYYTPYLNFSSNPREDLLRTIEYGAFPSYIVTNTSAYHLDDTPSGDIYSSEYSIWKDKIVKDASFIQETLKPVIDAVIVDRVILSEGISEIKYSNGINIYVNYTDVDYKVDGLLVKAQDFSIYKGGE